ncbi:MAG: M48 family metallopeptidase [Planctomycetaceae bacterium]|nr:M48 family metallopeptidase [Planctomycetaceae bacterium]
MQTTPRKSTSVCRSIQTLSVCLTVGSLITTLVVSGCQSVPVSERKRLYIAVPTSYENQMGLQAYQEILDEEPLTKNQQYSAMVKRVGSRIAAVANQPDFDWEFNVIESETQNAFCLPGGKVAIYTGILPVCENEAGLAVVMSHEIAHAIARHGGERMQQNVIRVGGQKVTEYVTREASEEKKQLILAAYGGATEYGFILPYSRKHELEADEIGLLLMAEAGYDPSEAPLFWDRFAAQKQGEAPMEFMSTHPSDVHRASALRELLPRATAQYEQSATKYGVGEPIR